VARASYQQMVTLAKNLSDGFHLFFLELYPSFFEDWHSQALDVEDEEKMFLN
jgi:hypothetical protein